MENYIRKIFKDNNLKCDKIVKSESGFTNQVYFVDDKYVIKIANENNIAKLNKEVLFYQNVHEDFIPKYICSGSDYLIITKLKGKSLYNIWHLIDDTTRESIVKDICNILQKINNYSGDFIPEKYRFEQWKIKWQKSFALNIDILKKRGFKTDFLSDFVKTKLDEIMSEQKICLVYNDAHFDNFIYDGKLYIIDFDRVIMGSSDYELLIMDSMLDNPLKFASEEEEKFVNMIHYTNVRDWLKKYYPELYNYTYIDDRVFIYKFFYRLGAGYEYNHDDWISNALSDFKKRFGYN